MRKTLAVLLVLLLTTGCQSLFPSNHRDWSPDHAELSRAAFDENLVHVRNIRHCTYRSVDDYDVRYYHQTFNLDELESVDFIVVPFPLVPALAHSMLSFGFAGGQHVCVSVETRRERGEKYDPFKGMLQHYELIYVVGDERDLIGLRTNHRLEDVYVYRARATRQQVRELFVDVMNRVNKLAEQPEFYNTLANNCTYNIVRHVNKLAPNRIPLDYRVWLTGYSDELAYDLGLLDTDDPFPQARQAARVNDLAYQFRDADDFSTRIRR